MQFDLRFAIYTIGPLQLEYVVALLVTTGLARLAALGVWALLGSLEGSVRTVVGSVVGCLVGLLVLVLPDLMLAWLFSISHAGAMACTVLVWPGLLIPLFAYVWGLWRFARKEREMRAVVGLS